jgi:hypothetical protein
MQFVKIGAVLALVFPLAGCLENDAERAVAGAAAGAVVASATDNDIATGAVVGAAGGVFCDDLGICRPSR